MGKPGRDLVGAPRQILEAGLTAKGLLPRTVCPSAQIFTSQNSAWHRAVYTSVGKTSASRATNRFSRRNMGFKIQATSLGKELSLVKSVRHSEELSQSEAAHPQCSMASSTASAPLTHDAADVHGHAPSARHAAHPEGSHTRARSEVNSDGRTPPALRPTVVCSSRPGAAGTKTPLPDAAPTHPAPTGRAGTASGKGIFTRQCEARQQALVKSLASMGLADMAGAEAQRLRAGGCELDRETASALLSMQAGHHQWRTQWTAYRPVPNVGASRETRLLRKDIKYMTSRANQICEKAAVKAAELQLMASTNADICEHNSAVMILDMWDLRVRLPFKDPDYIRAIRADAGFTLKELKRTLHELEGFHPAQQLLYILDPEPAVVMKVKCTVPLKYHQQMHASAFEPVKKFKKIALAADAEEVKLSVLNINSNTILEMAIDKAVGKELQRQMLMEQIGVEGDFFEKKTLHAFERFDVDGGGTIEGSFSFFLYLSLFLSQHRSRARDDIGRVPWWICFVIHLNESLDIYLSGEQNAFQKCNQSCPVWTIRVTFERVVSRRWAFISGYAIKTL